MKLGELFRPMPESSSQTTANVIEDELTAAGEKIRGHIGELTGPLKDSLPEIIELEEDKLRPNEFKTTVTAYLPRENRLVYFARRYYTLSPDVDGYVVKLKEPEDDIMLNVPTMAWLQHAFDITEKVGKIIEATKIKQA